VDINLLNVTSNVGEYEGLKLFPCLTHTSKIKVKLLYVFSTQVNLVLLQSLQQIGNLKNGYPLGNIILKVVKYNSKYFCVGKLHDL
jgi:hypothetical protein